MLTVNKEYIKHMYCYVCVTNVIIYLPFHDFYEKKRICVDHVYAPNMMTMLINPSIAEDTFIQNIKTQRFLKTIQILSRWYSLHSSR